MGEETLAQPLSGEEIILAILKKIGDSLEKDCFLSPMMAYEGFEADIHITVRAKDLGREVEVKRDVAIAGGEPVDDDDVFLRETEIALSEAPPNQVRLDADLPIPTLVETSDGKRTIRDIFHKKPK
jgi:hypothetical protein